MLKTPIFFFAFANDRRPDGRPLRNLPNERRKVLEAFKSLISKKALRIVDLPHATPTEVCDELLKKHSDQIRLFHFGGHAGDGALMFDTVDGEPAPVHGKGLATLLGKRKIKLVFLNGCATQDHATELLGAGVGSVILTTEVIEDKLAAEFAARFYQGIAAGRSIRRAFDDATDAIETSYGAASSGSRPKRSFVPDASSVPDAPFVHDVAPPWRLLPGTGAECILVEPPGEGEGGSHRLSRFTLGLLAIYLAIGLFGELQLTELRLKPGFGSESICCDGISFEHQSAMIIYMLEGIQHRYYPWTVPLSKSAAVLALSAVCGFIGGAIRDSVHRIATSRWPNLRNDFLGLVIGILSGTAIVTITFLSQKDMPYAVAAACLALGFLAIDTLEFFGRSVNRSGK